jgi:hypothetical protein
VVLAAQVEQEIMELELALAALAEMVLVQQVAIKVLETLVVHQMVMAAAVAAAVEWLLVQPFKQIHKEQMLKVAMADLVHLA